MESEFVTSTIEDEPQNYEDLTNKVKQLQEKLEEAERRNNTLTVMDDKKKPANKDAISELKMRLEQSKRATELAQKEKENIVMKFAMSEQSRLKSLEELRVVKEKLDNGGVSLEKITELNSKLESLTTENKKLTTQVEEQKKKSATLQESVKLEQKKNQMLHENVTRLTKDLELTRKQARDADKYREREAERLCAEVAAKGAMEKAKKIEQDCHNLKVEVERIPELEQELSLMRAQLLQVELERDQLHEEKELRKQDASRCDSMSDFTKKLTESNSMLRTAQLTLTNQLAEVQAQAAAQQKQITQLEQQLDEAKQTLMVDNLQAKVAELVEQRDRVTLQRKRDQSRIKDLTRQLNRSSRLLMTSSIHSENGGGTRTTGVSPAESTLSIQTVDESCSNNNNFSFKTPLMKQLTDLSKLGPALMANGMNGHAMQENDFEFDEDEEIALTPELLSTLQGLVQAPAGDAASSGKVLSGKTSTSMAPVTLQFIKRMTQIQQHNAELAERVDFLQDSVNSLTTELSKTKKSPTVVEDRRHSLLLKSAKNYSSWKIDESTEEHLRQEVETLAEQVVYLKRINSELKELVAGVVLKTDNTN